MMESKNETWDDVIQCVSRKKYNVECQGQVFQVPVTEHFTINGYPYGYVNINGKKQMVRQSHQDKWETIVE